MSETAPGNGNTTFEHPIGADDILNDYQLDVFRRLVSIESTIAEACEPLHIDIFAIEPEQRQTFGQMVGATVSQHADDTIAEVKQASVEKAAANKVAAEQAGIKADDSKELAIPFKMPGSIETGLRTFYRDKAPGIDSADRVRHGKALAYQEEFVKRAMRNAHIFPEIELAAALEHRLRLRQAASAADIVRALLAVYGARIDSIQKAKATHLQILSAGTVHSRSKYYLEKRGL
ncbi:MAG TPA: hypothetical protein VF575_01250 [Candidatus Saccharimonadales bacterium]|jgi:hypothetical protein